MSKGEPPVKFKQFKKPEPNLKGVPGQAERDPFLIQRLVPSGKLPGGGALPSARSEPSMLTVYSNQGDSAMNLTARGTKFYFMEVTKTLKLGPRTSRPDIEMMKQDNLNLCKVVRNCQADQKKLQLTVRILMEGGDAFLLI